jgi:hypothetical protein
MPARIGPSGRFSHFAVAIEIIKATIPENPENGFIKVAANNIKANCRLFEKNNWA